jgi:hypothetical protein
MELDHEPKQILLLLKPMNLPFVTVAVSGMIYLQSVMRNIAY